jgi:hypothetical protein
MPLVTNFFQVSNIEAFIQIYNLYLKNNQKTRNKDKKFYSIKCGIFKLKSKNQELMHKLFDSMNEKTKTVNKRNSKNDI